MEKKEVVEMLLSRIDVQGLAMDVVLKLAKPKLEELVAKSENKIDDVVLATLWPMFEMAVKEGVEAGLKKLKD